MKKHLLKILQEKDFDEFDYFVDTYMSGNWDYVIKFLLQSDIPKDLYTNYLKDRKPLVYYSFLRNNNISIASDLLSEYSDFYMKDNRIYLYMSERNEAKIFFDDGGYSNNYSSQDIANKVLSDDNDGSYFYNDYVDLENGILDNLNEKNMNQLKELILKELGGTSIETEDGEYKISSEFLKSIDNKELSQIIEYKSQYYSDLINLYSTSENYAYENELWDNVYGGLKDLLSVKEPFLYENKTITRSDGSKINRDYHYLDITNISEEIVNLLFEESVRHNNWEPDNYSYISDVINELYFDVNSRINFRTPYYPDYSLTVKNLNELFNDYL